MNILGGNICKFDSFCVGVASAIRKKRTVEKGFGNPTKRRRAAMGAGGILPCVQKMFRTLDTQKNEGKEVVSFFQNRGIKRVAIYGLSQTGRLLYEELRKTEVAVVCGIDRSKNYSVNRLPTIRLDAVTPEGLLKDVELVVVIPIYDFPSIYDTLNEKLHGRIPIVGLDEILCEL